MTDIFKKLIFFAGLALIGVISINCISLKIEITAPNGIDLDHRLPYTLRVEHSGNVKQNVDFPYGVSIR
jgi:hypothetical protein